MKTVEQDSNPAEVGLGCRGELRLPSQFSQIGRTQCAPTEDSSDLEQDLVPTDLTTESTEGTKKKGFN